MTQITAPLAAHHKACDGVFANMEEAVSKGKWPEAGALLSGFGHALETHFGIEENELFPAFEAATGMTGGPTRMMRLEHTQMRALIADLNRAFDAKDKGEFLGNAETLLMLMQQHNMKEENILYPMCDQALGFEADRLGPAISASLAS